MARTIRFEITLWLFLALLCLCNSAFAETYIITKDGKGFWASSARKDAKAVYYVDKTTGQERTLPLTQVDGLVERVQKGTQYKPEQIQASLENLKALHARHMLLNRDLNPLKQEWESLQRGDPGFGGQIDAIAEGFKSSDKGVKAYKSATMDLGMIKYKDVQGKHTARVDGLLGSIKSEYLAVGFARLGAMAATNRISVNDFLEARSLAGALSDAGQKEKASALMATIGQVALSCNAKEASDRFAASRTVDAYLVSNDTLARLKSEVASSEEDKKKIDAMSEGLLRVIAKAQPAYNFSFRGYPLTTNDNTILSSLQRFSARVTFTSSDLDEQCFVFPLQEPENIRMNKPFSVPLRFIFNRAQPKDRVFGIMVLIPGMQGMESHTVALGDLQIKNGHVDVTFKDAFNLDDSRFTPAPDTEGEYGAYISLGYRTTGEGEPAQWRAISRACRFPLQAGRGI